jgi:hypothetical protein
MDLVSNLSIILPIPVGVGYTCCKCNYQWTRWNSSNQRAEEPIPKNCPKCRNVRWNQRYLDEELALVNRYYIIISFFSIQREKYKECNKKDERICIF